MDDSKTIAASSQDQPSHEHHRDQGASSHGQRHQDVQSKVGHTHHHGHTQGDDPWSGEEYLKKPRLQEVAELTYMAVIGILKDAGLASDGMSELNLLDIGCGAGAVTTHYAKSFGSVHGIDVSPSMLLALSKRLPPRTTYALHALSPDSEEEFRTGKLMFSPTPDNQERQQPPPRAQFDVAVANWVVHHISDVEGFMAGAKGLVRPGGCLILTEFGMVEGEQDVVAAYREDKRKESEEAKSHGHHHEDRTHPVHNAFTVSSITTLLEQYGFVDVHADLQGVLPVWEDAAKNPRCLVVRGRKP